MVPLLVFLPVIEIPRQRNTRRNFNHAIKVHQGKLATTLVNSFNQVRIMQISNLHMNFLPAVLGIKNGDAHPKRNPRKKGDIFLFVNHSVITNFLVLCLFLSSLSYFNMKLHIYTSHRRILLAIKKLCALFLYNLESFN